MIFPGIARRCNGKLCRLSCGQPPLQQTRAFGGGLTQEKILDAHVLVQIGPVDAATAADEAPIQAIGASKATTAQAPATTKWANSPSESPIRLAQFENIELIQSTIQYSFCPDAFIPRYTSQ